LTTGGERRRDEHDAFAEVTRLLKTLLDGRGGDGRTVLRHIEIIDFFMFGRLLRDRCIKNIFCLRVISLLLLAELNAKPVVNCATTIDQKSICPTVVSLNSLLIGVL
jgi:hypothetical protein